MDTSKGTPRRTRGLGSRHLAMALVLTMPALALADDKTVATSGGDYTSIQAALDALNATGPHTITVKAGTYTLTAPVLLDGKNASGTVSNLITIKADPTATVGTVIVNAAASTRAFELKKSKFVTIRGLTIVGGTTDAIYLQGGNTNQNTDVTIERCDIRGAGSSSSTRGAVTVGRGNARTLIVNNVIRSNNSRGIEFGVDSAATGTHEKFVVNNTIYANTHSGIAARADEIVHIVNNVIAGNSLYGVQMTTSTTSPANKTLKNNLFYKNGGTTGDFDDKTLWLDAADATNKTTNGTEGTGVSGSVYTGTTNAVTALFESTSSFRNASASPAVNGGLNTYTVSSVEYVPTEDFEAHSRTLSSSNACDLGYDEQPLLPSVASVWDTDRDGLTDTDEVTRGTNRLLKDTDGDTWEDGVEVSMGWDPLSSSSPGVLTDTDKDGIPDTSDTYVTKIDGDGDRVRDAWEIAVNGDLTGSLTSTLKRVEMGDINDDGSVTSADASLLMTLVLANDSSIAAQAFIRDADIDRDGDVDRNDASLLSYFVQSRIPYLPYR
jgi:hypothetical protein